MEKQTILKIAKHLVSMGMHNDQLQKMIFGTYTDGEARSAIDAYHNEMLSPKDRLLIEERMEQIRKKKEKKKKKKRKKRKSYDFLEEDMK